MLQHGSLPLWGDLTRITQALSYPDNPSREAAAARLLEHATTVENVLQRRIEWSEAAQAFVEGFQDVLNLEFNCVNLSDSETERARQLVAEKYSKPSWLERI